MLLSQPKILCVVEQTAPKGPGLLPNSSQSKANNSIQSHEDGDTGQREIQWSLVSKEFTPIGLTTLLIWGSRTNARIPRWIAAPFYVGLGLLILYWGIRGR
jgi:hypothetical protein